MEENTMTKFEEYLNMKEESNKVNTEREIHAFIKKYKCMPNSMIKELQAKIDIINAEHKANGRGIVHLIHTY